MSYLYSFLQIIVQGISVGGVYALVALGFVLIYKATKVINFAQGHLLLLGAYLYFFFAVELSLNPLLAIAASSIVAACVGFSIERFLLRKMLGEPLLSVMMLTLALTYIIRGIVQIFWGGQYLALGDKSVFPSGAITIGSVKLGYAYAGGLLTSLAVVGLFTIFFLKTRTGVAMRAVANDQRAAFAVGINVFRIFALSWAISSVVAVLGGVVFANIFGGVNINFESVGIKVFPAVIIGGLDSLPGAIVGGFLLGILESVAKLYLNPILGGNFHEVFPLLVMLAVLLVKPYGLFGTEEIERL